MRVQKFQTALLAACGALVVAGCMVPVHRLPHGFSSSYHRHLYGMEPVVIGGIPHDGIEPNTSPGVFFPARVQLSAPPSASTPDPSARADRKPVPFTISPPEQDKKAAAKAR